MMEIPIPENMVFVLKWGPMNWCMGFETSDIEKCRETGLYTFPTDALAPCFDSPSAAVIPISAISHFLFSLTI